MKKFLLLIVIGMAIYGLAKEAPKYFADEPIVHSDISTSDISLKNVFENNQSNIQVGGSGTVIKILPDDTLKASSILYIDIFISSVDFQSLYSLH